MASYASFFTGDKTENTAQPDAASPYCILLVDDEPNVLKALQRVFRQEHYRVLMAENGEAALNILRNQPCQIVISDYMMPGMDGANLLKRIKSLYPETIRIMLTGHADTGAVMGAINEGAVYKFILKPWNDDDLRVTVALALEQFDLAKKNRVLTQQNEQQTREISALARMTVSNRSQLAIMLHKRELLNGAQLQELHRLQSTRKEPIIKLLLEKAWVSEAQIRDLLVKHLLIQEIALPEQSIDPAVAALIPQSMCMLQWVLPLRLDGRKLTLAMADPLDTGLIDDIRFATDLQVEPVLASHAAITAKIRETYGEEIDFKELETLVGSPDPYEGIEVVIDEESSAPLEDLLRETEEPPAIRLVNAIILEAMRLGASDIHIQPRIKSVVVRYRIDGILIDKIQIPHQLHQSLVSRIKIMSELDISERRRPQDGRITIKSPLKIVDLRVSTLPTINGEKVVMRLLDRNSAVQRIEQLGLSEGDLAKVLCMISKPQGIILATGPTGSGKTTTLYSLLQHDATPSKNYVTIEDPVEYYMDMAGQILVKEKIGLSFPVILRSILRQDPDVILLGEIRDLETAEVAFHAALTGHQVFSTLHTNSAIATIARLLDLGLKPYVIATATEGIIAQRLVRRICPHCSEPALQDPEVAKRMRYTLPPDGMPGFRGKGCVQCHGTGYRGRVGLYEVLHMTDTLRNLVGQGASLLEITEATRNSGQRTLFDDGFDKVRQGLTTLDELLRVLGPMPVENP
ncbi:Type II secretory pathway ATPase GspE/PulE or T4P pilus assembly pathway ATPase PilB [Formivibrio citricus]|uniref:Type II secretory pathway ATPase GspE/PulE or T4P pilus assembly pathway ATPase PilB n=1 Tax=Formivibrio citricus TaxID=83765 RepID=A0A1I4Y6S4_9NEIS|nr:ATPase, T2SS/T4P/T4SS family [Formivibrio citricus]SFN33782.1 Type II secretory pathway ATPase GspE/PulE or T4P pilus assembly pathway ATPase PilB [Formivibrio citricus]